MLVILACAFRRVDLWPQNSSGPIWIKMANSPCWACCDPSPKVKLRHAVGKDVHSLSPKYSFGKYLALHLEIISQLTFCLGQGGLSVCLSSKMSTLSCPSLLRPVLRPPVGFSFLCWSLWPASRQSPVECMPSG